MSEQIPVSIPEDLSRRTWLHPTAESFTGSVVSLSRLQPDRDIDDLYEISHADEKARSLWRYLPGEPFNTREAMLDWLRSLEGSNDPMFYTVRSNENNKAVGMISIMSIAASDGRAELGHIWYGPSAQRTSINTETIFLLLGYLFDDLSYRRVEWKCDNANEPSKRAAVRLGFRYEGLFRKHRVVKGLNRDTAWFSIIDSEWPTLKSAFQRHLSDTSVSLSELVKALDR